MARTAAPSDDPDPDTDTADNRARPCRSCGVAHNTPQLEDEIEVIAAELDDEWEPLMAPVIDPVRKLVAEVGSLEELRQRLPEALGDMDAGALIEDLAIATAKARGLGDIGQ